MNKTTATVALIGMFGMLAVPLGAQGRRNSQGIPPGQMPPAGQCRVWYDGVPPGRQPRATSCREAERIAARDRNARVIYGANTDRRNGGWWDPREDRDGRAIPRPTPYPYPDRYPSGRYPNSRGSYRYSSVAFDNGYNDGLDKGREDGRDADRPGQQEWTPTHAAEAEATHAAGSGQACDQGREQRAESEAVGGDLTERRGLVDRQDIDALGLRHGGAGEAEDGLEGDQDNEKADESRDAPLPAGEGGARAEGVGG